MVLDNIGQKSDFADFPLGFKAAVSVIVRGDLLTVVPAFAASAENGLVEIKHAGEIAVLTDKIRDFLRLFVEHFPHGEGVVLFESAVPHFSQKFADSPGFLQHFHNAAQAVLPVRRVIAERVGLFDVDNGVNPKTGKTLVEPPVNIFVNFLSQFGIFPV